MKDTVCDGCFRSQSLKLGTNSQLRGRLIHEFKHSYFVLGDHQYFEGYCVLLLKAHVRELHELASNTQVELFQELMTAGQAVHDAFKPWKLNYSCYGNFVEHIHWHIFPRYESDPDHKVHPWLNSEKFSAKIPTESEVKSAVISVQKHLKA